MRVSQFQYLKEYFDVKMEGVDIKLEAINENLLRVMDTVDKINGRVTLHDSQILDLKMKDASHVKDCPNTEAIRELKKIKHEDIGMKKNKNEESTAKDRLDMKRQRWLIVTIALINLIVVMLSFLNN